MVLSQDSVSHGEIDAAPNLPEVPPPVHTLLGDQSDGTNEAEPHRNIQRDTTPFKEVGVPDQDPIQHASGSNIVTEDLGFHPSGTQASAMLSQSKASGSSHGSLGMYTHLSSKSKGKWKEGAQPSNSDLIATPASTHIQGARRKKVVVEEYVEEEDVSLVHLLCIHDFGSLLFGIAVVAELGSSHLKTPARIRRSSDPSSPLRKSQLDSESYYHFGRIRINSLTA